MIQQQLVMEQQMISDVDTAYSTVSHSYYAHLLMNTLCLQKQDTQLWVIFLRLSIVYCCFTVVFHSLVLVTEGRLASKILAPLIPRGSFAEQVEENREVTAHPGLHGNGI